MLAFCSVSLSHFLSIFGIATSRRVRENRNERFVIITTVLLICYIHIIHFLFVIICVNYVLCFKWKCNAIDMNVCVCAKKPVHRSHKHLLLSVINRFCLFKRFYLIGMDLEIERTNHNQCSAVKKISMWMNTHSHSIRCNIILYYRDDIT